jgi:8-oxo-dGTP pyrophosphatase MutT (NUDIX family)
VRLARFAAGRYVRVMIRQERSAGFVVFYRPPPGPAGSTPEFLLLDYGRHWDFPKGHVEEGENDLQAAIRELGEETGILNARVVSGFQREMTYYFRHKRHGLIRKTVVFFLAETPSRDVTISHEHSGFVFVPFEEATKRLTFPTARQMLRAAWEQLSTPAGTAEK